MKVAIRVGFGDSGEFRLEGSEALKRDPFCKLCSWESPHHRRSAVALELGKPNRKSNRHPA